MQKLAVLAPWSPDFKDNSKIWKRNLITEYKTLKSWKCEHVWKDKRKCKNTFNKNLNVNTTPLTRFANDDDAKVAQTGGSGLQFCWSWGRNEKSGWKQYTGGKQRTELIVSPKLVLRRVLPPQFFISISCTVFVSHNKVLQIFSTGTQFQILVTLWIHSNWGWNRV
jgi:hypothetical protein